LKKILKEAAKMFQLLPGEVMATSKLEKKEKENPQMLFNKPSANQTDRLSFRKKGIGRGYFLSLPAIESFLVYLEVFDAASATGLFAEQIAQEKFDIVLRKSFHTCSNAQNAANKSLT
jgi:hypothetical protein